MKRKDILQHLEERLARGEISEKTYLDIKARYDAEPEEAGTPDMGFADLGASIHETVARATEEAARATGEAMRTQRDVLRSIDFSGVGVRVSDEEIRILGSGVVSGNPVKTGDFKVSGSARVHGPLECGDAKVAGSCDFDGDVRCADFRSSGSSRVSGSLHAEDLEVSGSLAVAKDVEANDITASGALRVDGGVRGLDFRSTGSVRIQGTLKANDVDIELGGSSKIGAIEGQDVRVQMTGGFIRARGDLTVDRIIGHDVYLEGTTAQLVQAGEVRLGPHCHVEKVIAQDLTVHESSEVRERQVPNA